MCTVSYLPAPAGYILTHNRDEAPSRSPKSIARVGLPDGRALLFPRDTMAGGSWIATSRQGQTACILNGAFLRHQRQPPYRRSRGLMLLDFFEYKNPDDFFRNYDFTGIEPFTFLYFEPMRRVVELRWDEQRPHLKELDATQAHFWCSSTLYPPEMQARREQVFRDWLAHKQPLMTNPQPSTLNRQRSSILHLHLTGSVGDPEYDFVMSRWGKVQTVSVSQVTIDEKNARMRYLDLLGGNERQRWLVRR